MEEFAPLPLPQPPYQSQGSAPPPIQQTTVAASSTIASSRGSPVHKRDRVVIIGRRRAGKTIFLARLYEALWQGCKLLDGRVLAAGEDPGAKPLVKMSCRATNGNAHSQLMRVAEELAAGRWPAATIGNSYSELKVLHNGVEHIVTALDYPGEVFRKAFMTDSDDPDAVELLTAIDRAAAAIFLIDPSVVSSGGAEAHEDTFGMTQAAERIRSGVSGMSVPIAIVFTKCDVHKALLKEVGGVKAFASKHFRQMFRSVERTSVFPCAAVRVTQNALGKTIPRVDRAPENVVEPLRYCLEMIEAGTDRQRLSDAQQSVRSSRMKAEQEVLVEEKRASTAWLIFIVAVIILFAVVGIATFILVSPI